jgi:hypothetical protein
VSPVLIILTIAIILTLISQFGDRISARYALVWWLASAGLLVCASIPSYLSPLARILGIETISNMILAGLVVFLFAQAFELTADLSRTDRRLRLIISELTAEKVANSIEVLAPAPRVLVIVPCFNEAASIRLVHDKLVAAARELERISGMSLLICFIDDGSIDATPDVLQEIRRSRIPVLIGRHSANSGVAGVLLTGFMIASRLDCNYAVQCDGDGQHPIHEIPELIQFAASNNSDLVIGSRFTATESPRIEAEKSTTQVRQLGIGWLRTVMRVTGFTTGVTDPTSGFRVYSRRAMTAISAQMPDEYPEPECIAIAHAMGLKINEFPVKMLPRTAGRSSLTTLKSIRYLVKVTSAIVGLRLRLAISALAR